MKTRAIMFFKRLAAIALFAPALTLASEALHLDKAPVSTAPENLIRGATLFVNYCLNCHSASAVRYSDLQKIGLDAAMIEKNLLFTGGKIGDLMTVAMTREDAEAWFGTAPPDLSLIARAKASESGSGADYLYTYLRSFYQDTSRPTGWNNTIFANVGMPHAMADMQGVQTLVEATDEKWHKTTKLVIAKSGSASPETYDKTVADLVSFLVWMGEPISEHRKSIGVYVLIFLAGLWVLTHFLGKTYWKHIH